MKECVFTQEHVCLEHLEYVGNFTSESCLEYFRCKVCGKIFFQVEGGNIYPSPLLPKNATCN